MDQQRAAKQVPSRWRAWALILAGVLIGLLFIAPASAHIGSVAHLWGTHIRPKADARYLQKTIFYRRSAQLTITGDGDFTSGQVACPTGTRAISGGINVDAQGIELVQSAPTNGSFQTGFTHWLANAKGVGTSGTFRVYAICLKSTKVDSNYAAGIAPN